MKAWAILLACMLVAACAQVPLLPADQFLNDRSFAAPSQRISVDDVFAVSPEMKRYLAGDIATDVKLKGPQQGLFDALYSRDQLQLDYESDITRNASQAFAARRGNCLSLVIMTAAFAKEMGLNVTYGQIYLEPTWSRTGEMYVMIGHVNLTLGQRFSEVSPHYYYQADKLTIDFLPPSEVRGLKTRVIPEKTIVAMYMNNRAVESMADGQLDDAYWWAREAVKQDPKFTSAFNTLGAIYEQHGDLKAAQRVLSYVLTREPKNTRAMSNLATALDGLGRSVEAGELRTEMARLEPDPPFSYFNRGLAAMSHGDYKLAKAMFAKEVDRAPYYHEFHYWLAAACAQLGELDTAQQQLALAIENSPTRRARDIYAAKLDRINAYRTGRGAAQAGEPN